MRARTEADVKRRARDSKRRPTKKLRKRSRLAFFSDITGNATTETVIMLPAFIIIWGCIIYVHQAYTANQDMSMQTRADTWAHAYNDCQGGAMGDTRIGESSQDSSGFIGGIVDLILTVAPGFDFEVIEGQRNTSVAKPTILGEGSIALAHNLVVYCNEESRPDESLLEQAWGFFF